MKAPAIVAALGLPVLAAGLAWVHATIGLVNAAYLIIAVASL